VDPCVESHLGDMKVKQHFSMMVANNDANRDHPILTKSILKKHIKLWVEHKTKDEIKKI